jgi:m7GpppX diphosphatase
LKRPKLGLGNDSGTDDTYLCFCPADSDWMGTQDRVRFLVETGEMHASAETRAFIEQEVERPSKQWVGEVVQSSRESESVRLRTEDFVLLPDINCNRRVCKQAPRAGRARMLEDGGQVKRFNWLAIVTDPSIRSIRDLRGEHLGMLEELQRQCIAAIQREYEVEAEDVMVFANYPPSVYRLHFHLCAPFFKPSAYDAFRMHPLSAIINNLRIHPEYYKVSAIQIPVHRNSELYTKEIKSG